MIYWLLVPWADRVSGVNVVRYLTFRGAWGMLTAIALCAYCYPRFIDWMKARRLEQVVREDGPASHLATKAHTPTMGGLVLIGGVTVASLLWARLDSPVVWLVLGVLNGYGAIGWLDDYLKLKRRSSAGLAGRYKLLGQLVIGVIALGLGLWTGVLEPAITIPFYKGGPLDFREIVTGMPNLAFLYWLFALFMLLGTSNGVNLTDGLDGLVIGPVMTTAATYAIIAYLAGNTRFSGYLAIPYVPGAGELFVVMAALIGGSLGFLWYNAFPASVFMGDVGSLALGGCLAMMALMTRQELLLAVVGVVFVMEAGSVILQVTSFRYRGGKRIFLMSPIHHHFEKLGWSEPKIVTRFWIFSIIGALLALSTLKLR